MPWVTHKIIVDGVVKYAVFSTVVMDYLTGFLPKDEFVEEYKKLYTKRYPDDVNRAEEMANKAIQRSIEMRTEKTDKGLAVIIPVYRLQFKGFFT